MQSTIYLVACIFLVYIHLSHRSLTCGWKPLLFFFFFFFRATFVRLPTVARNHNVNKSFKASKYMYTSSWSVHAHSPFIKSLDSELHYNHGSAVSLDARALHSQVQNHGHGPNCCYKGLHSSGLRCWNLVAGICFSEVKHWCWVIRSAAWTVLKFMELRSGGCTPVKLCLHQTGKPGFC